MSETHYESKQLFVCVTCELRITPEMVPLGEGDVLVAGALDLSGMENAPDMIFLAILENADFQTFEVTDEALHAWMATDDAEEPHDLS